MILALKNITGSLAKSLDILYVIEGGKPVSRILFNEKNNELIEFLSENGLHYELSDFKIIKHTDKTRNYSDKGLRVKKEDRRDGAYFMYVSKDKRLAEKAKGFEEKNDHFQLGKLLGYPECCCKFFEKNHDEISNRTNDYTLKTFKESNGINFPWQNNNCLRGSDISLISHFPCNFNCEATKRIALNNLELIQKHDTDIANYYSNALKSLMIYSEGIGVFTIRHFRQDGNIISYLPASIIPSCRNDFYSLLKRRNKIMVLGKNEFLVGEARVKDAQTFLAVFS